MFILCVVICMALSIDCVGWHAECLMRLLMNPFYVLFGSVLGSSLFAVAIALSVEFSTDSVNVGSVLVAVSLGGHGL